MFASAMLTPREQCEEKHVNRLSIEKCRSEERTVYSEMCVDVDRRGSMVSMVDI